MVTMVTMFPVNVVCCVLTSRLILHICFRTRSVGANTAHTSWFSPPSQPSTTRLTEQTCCRASCHGTTSSATSMQTANTPRPQTRITLQYPHWSVCWGNTTSSPSLLSLTTPTRTIRWEYHWEPWKHTGNIVPIHIYFFLCDVQKLQVYFPIAEVGLLQEDSSNILQVMETAFEVNVEPVC